MYAAINRKGEEFKRKPALHLINSEKFGTSAQVLQEFYVTVVKKAKRPLGAAEALEWIQQFAVFPCQPIDRQIALSAIEVAERHRISYWDGAILTSAMSLGCHTVYSEDLSDGQLYGSVRVVNPFR